MKCSTYEGKTKFDGLEKEINFNARIEFIRLQPQNFVFLSFFLVCELL